MTTGIDCSKDSLDYSVISGEKRIGYGKVSNNKKGFETLLKHIKDSHVVMEATGPYSVPLALFLAKNDVKVSVVNPLVIKRFSQMRLSRAKTDRKDALMIAQYGQTEKPDLWKPPSALTFQLQQLEAYLEMLKKMMLCNQLHAFKSSGVLLKDLDEELQEQIHGFERKIKEKEKEINQLINQEYKDLMNNLTSIPRIGKRSATLMIINTRGFQDFQSHKQLISYFGLSPQIFESGTSVKGKAKICKMGMSQVRKTLYMDALSAILYNKACKGLYDRLRANGKHTRVALIAVVNKMIKQAFAIAKSNRPYQVDYVRI
ncbi:MAG: IS110 family transposase [Sphingobacterium sp.]